MLEGNKRSQQAECAGTRGKHVVHYLDFGFYSEWSRGTFREFWAEKGYDLTWILKESLWLLYWELTVGVE